ncbi:MAG: nitrate/sulfonate/bicarbonate ABC transporter ATP-binding protein [Acidocella sp.]|uniref:ABC transporter ATP-binding protein n=1 Tax=Acidocella sp. TaxID=50710 RepID=UPI003FC83BA8
MPEAITTDGATSGVELDLRHVGQTYPRPSGERLVVLEDISLTLREGEIVGLLGRSGCGKSTLLRIVAGLTPPTCGEVRYRSNIVRGPAEGIALVFQSFALFPWLTVLQNVQAGLDAIGVPEEEARKRTLAAIDLIGLDGFENAYPRELSGGMRQRVGFARAMVVDPTILLMDEPFSALDVLTGETLRSDFMGLWTTRHLPIKSILLVTHNIEEAVFMCDRVLILSSHPGRVVAEIEIPLRHPRQRLSLAFRDVVDDIYSRMMAGPVPVVEGQQPEPIASIATRLPNMSAMRITGLAEMLAGSPFNGRADLPALAARAPLDVNALFRLAEVAQVMGFAELHGGGLHLTTAGHALTEADMAGRKRLFAEHLLRSIPLAAHIRRVLDERPGHAAPRVRFVTELEDHLSTEDAQHTLSAVINWGRYAECFTYDHPRRLFSLENPE